MSSPSTGYDASDLLWGRSHGRRRHWLLFVGGYVLVMLVLFALLSLVQRIEPLVGEDTPRLVYRMLFPFVLFYAVPLVSAVSAYCRGGLLVSAALGVAPSLTFGAVVAADTVFRFLATGEYVTRGDSPLWGLMLVFGLFGLVGALVGYLVGTATRVGVDWYRTA